MVCKSEPSTELPFKGHTAGKVEKEKLVTGLKVSFLYAPSLPGACEHPECYLQIVDLANESLHAEYSSKQYCMTGASSTCESTALHVKNKCSPFRERGNTSKYDTIAADIAR